MNRSMSTRALLTSRLRILSANNDGTLSCFGLDTHLHTDTQRGKFILQASQVGSQRKAGIALQQREIQILRKTR